MKSWKALYKIRIRESEKRKAVLELYNMEIQQKKAGPDHHRLKTIVKRSIEQNLRQKNFEARNASIGRPVAKPMRSNPNLRVSWKPVNQQDCVWKESHRKFMRTILQERE